MRTRTLVNLREITHKEFHNLKAGNIVYVNINGQTVKSKVVNEPFYNADADDPDWEVETTNGFCDEYSLWVVA